MKSQTYRPAEYGGYCHPARNNFKKRLDKTVEHPLAHIVVTYVNRDAPHAQAVTRERTHVLSLSLAKHRQVHLGYDSESAVLIHHSHEGLYIACLIYASSCLAGLAEAESTFAQTLHLFHHPHILMAQMLGRKLGLTPETPFGEIYPKRLFIERNLKDALAHHSACCHGRVYPPSLQCLCHIVGAHLLYGQRYLRTFGAIYAYESGQYIRGYARPYGYVELARKPLFHIPHYLFYPCRLLDSLFGLSQDSCPYGRRDDAVACALEDSDVELFFELGYHLAERRLGYSAVVGRLGKAPVSVYSYYILQLLQGHESVVVVVIDFINAKIAKICCMSII